MIFVHFLYKAGAPRQLGAAPPGKISFVKSPFDKVLEPASSCQSKGAVVYEEGRVRLEDGYELSKGLSCIAFRVRLTSCGDYLSLGHRRAQWLLGINGLVVVRALKEHKAAHEGDPAVKTCAFSAIDAKDR